MCVVCFKPGRAVANEVDLYRVLLDDQLEEDGVISGYGTICPLQTLMLWMTSSLPPLHK